MTTSMKRLSEDTSVMLKRLVRDVKGSLKESRLAVSKKFSKSKKNDSTDDSKMKVGSQGAVEIYAADEFDQEPVQVLSPRVVMKSPRAALDSPRAKTAIESPRPVMDSPRVMQSPRIIDSNIPKQDFSDELSTKAHMLEANLAACSAIMGKLGNTVVPWDIKNHSAKVEEAKGQFDRSRANVKDLLAQLVAEAHRTREDASMLEERNKLRITTQEQEMALQKSFQIHTQQCSQIRSLLELIASAKLAQRDARGAAGGRFAVTSSEEMMQMLTESVEAMYYENQELMNNNVVLDKSKTDLTKRVKELSDKMRDENDVKDREMQRMKIALKKANDEKDATMGVAKEEVHTQITKKNSEMKSLQRRLEVAKTESEQAKAQSKALKITADQTAASLAQCQDEIKSLTKRLHESRLQKDNVARDLEQAKAEQSTIYSELRDIESNAAAAKRISGFYNKEARWPRIAYTQRNSKVLHNMGCGGVETNKCVPFQYSDFPELESYVREEGFVLCHSCRADPGF